MREVGSRKAILCIWKINFFYPIEDSFQIYLQRFQFYCSTNDIQSNIKKSLLLTDVGQVAFGKIKDSISPVTLEEATFDVIKEKLWEHYQPQLVSDAMQKKIVSQSDILVFKALKGRVK